MFAHKPDSPLISLVISKKRRSDFSMNISSEQSLAGSNALPPGNMTAAERRAQLCNLLALGLIRVKMNENGNLLEKKGELSLHSSPDLSVHATPSERENA